MFINHFSFAFNTMTARIQQHLGFDGNHLRNKSSQFKIHIGAFRWFLCVHEWGNYQITDKRDAYITLYTFKEYTRNKRHL